MVLKVVVPAFSSPHLQYMEFIKIAFVLPEFTSICGTAREFGRIMVRVLIKNHLQLIKQTKKNQPAVKCNKFLSFSIYFF